MKKTLLSLACLFGSLFTNAQSGAALNFDGGNDYIDIGTVSTQTNSYTKEAWIYANASGSNNIISSTNSPFWLAGNKLSVAHAWGSGFILSDPAFFPLNVWIHVAVTYDGSTNTLVLYKNGVAVATSASAPAYAAEDIHIGAYGTGNLFQGMIDEIRIWDIARTQCEINSYMNCEIPSSSTGLVANYHFNQGIASGNNSSETILTDATGNNPGALINFSLNGLSSNWVSPGGVTSGNITPSACTIASALNFDGANDQIALNPINISGNSARTIEFWMKTSNTGSFQNPFSSGSPNPSAAFNIKVTSAGYLGLMGFNNDNYPSSGTFIADNAFHHVAITYDGATAKAYVDGNHEWDFATNLNTIGENNFIGQSNHGGNEQYFGGTIDELRVWNVVRSQCDIISYKNCEIPAASTGLVANYHFNQGVDMMPNPLITSLTDASGNANNGTLSNFALTGSSSNWVAPGAIVSGFITPSVCTPAAALNFDGSNDDVRATGFPNFTEYTIEGWFNLNSLVDQNIIVGTGNGNPNAWFTNQLQLNGGKFTHYLYDGAAQIVTSTITPVTGVWYHVAIVAKNGTPVSIYVNGAPSVSSSNIGSMSGANEYRMAGTANGVLASFNGQMDELRIWNAARSQCEINTYMNCEIPSSATGLLANYHFNQGLSNSSNPTETILTDASGNGYTGTLNNFALTGTISNWVAPGAVVSGFTTTIVCPVAAALNFDGSNDGVNLGNSINAILDPLNTITVEAWVNPSTTTWLGVIAGNYNTASSGMQFLLRRDGDQYAFWVDAGNGFQVVNSGGLTVSVGSWQHVAGVWDGSELRIYIDGVLKATTTGVNGSSFVASSNNVWLGYNNVNESFMGSIDETRIWSVARTSCEINTYMNSEISNPMTGLLVNYHFNQGFSTYSNPTETTLTDASGNGYNGTLNSFGLTGTTSNWVAPGGVVSGYTMTTLTPPVISVNSGAICAGQSFTMVPSGAVTYTFSNGSAIATPTADATYSVSGSDAKGCLSNVDAISSVTVNALPTISVNSGSICTGQSFTMVPTGASTYTYSNGSSVATPTTDATYSVSGTDANGCVSNIDAISSVTVNVLPTITVNSGAICTGQSFTIVPTGATTYTYSSGSDIVTPTTDATYSVSGTDANGCVSNVDAISSVTVNALPTLMASTSNTLLCVGETATLSVTGTATSYTWSNGENTMDIVISPTIAITYMVDGSDANGCVNSTTILQDVSMCTGIVSLNGNTTSINVYPNPNNGLFIVDLNTTSQVSITNALGQVILTETIEAGKHNLDIQNQSTGIYFVKVIQQDKQHIIKLIKK